MQIRTILRSLGRRWYFVIIGLVMTLVLCFQVQQNTPEKFKAQASLVIMPSAHSVGVDGNPYLNLGGMGEALDILTRRLSAEDIRGKIADEFANASYTAETDRGTSGAILLITATSPNPDESLGTMRAVMDQAPLVLENMQGALNVPQESRISTMTLLVDSRATPESKARTQILLVAAAGGVGLTLVLTVLLDSLLKSRKARRHRQKGSRIPEEINHRVSVTAPALEPVRDDVPLTLPVSHRPS